MPLQWKLGVLTTGPPGKSLQHMNSSSMTAPHSLPKAPELPWSPSLRGLPTTLPPGVKVFVLDKLLNFIKTRVLEVHVDQRDLCCAKMKKKIMKRML